MRDNLSRTRVKICGITSAKDAQIAIRFGADALGFIFYEPSKRYIDPIRVAEIVAVLPPFVNTVAVVVDLELEELKRIIRLSGVDYIQFHGSEDPLMCRDVGLPYLKAVRVKPDTDIAAMADRYEDAKGLLLDTFVTDLPGGTGHSFDWSSIPKSMNMPLFLAGGLNSENVHDALVQVRPYGVDISSGVEKSPGIKDPNKVKRFIASVRAADEELQNLS